MAGLLVAVLAISAMGVMAMAQEADNTAVDQEAADTGADAAGETGNSTAEPQFLITFEQMQYLRETQRTMQENHSTRTEIREAVRTMAREFVSENLASYGLDEAEVEEIQAKLAELWAMNDETAQLAQDLWAQDMNMMDIRAQLEPLLNDTAAIRLELADMLDQYGIVMPGLGGKLHGRGFGDGTPWQPPESRPQGTGPEAGCGNRGPGNGPHGPGNDMNGGQGGPGGIPFP